MKKILGFAILAITGLSMATVAQQPCKQVCTTPTQCADSAFCTRAPRCMNPFEGLNLSQEQQEKLQSLRKDKADQNKKDRQDRKAKAQDNRRAYLKDVKSILTPEQYVQFLENNYVNAAPQRGPRDGKFMRDGRKDMKKFDKRARRDFKDMKKDVKREGDKVKKEAKKI